VVFAMPGGGGTESVMNTIRTLAGA
jgi:hypothetical protein